MCKQAKKTIEDEKKQREDNQRKGKNRRRVVMPYSGLNRRKTNGRRKEDS